MEWINNVNNTKEQLDAYCGVHVCWRRDEDCEAKNLCGVKMCLSRDSIIFEKD